MYTIVMLLKQLFKRHSLNLLLALVLFILILALRLETHPISMIWIFAGCISGSFLLDLDYYLFAFLVEPSHHFSIRVKEFFHQKNFLGMVAYVGTHTDSLPRLTLHSALFQVILAVVVLYVLTSSASLFGQAFVLSGFLSSIYKMLDQHFKTKNVDSWFWILKEKPTKRFIKIYLASLVIIFFYSLTFVG
ncbi:MAG: hypothetical protein ABIJ38_00565 [Patescibacteria group bacterium]